MNEQIDRLVDERALRLRHLAAMDAIGTIGDLGERWNLLFAVVCPSRELLEATRARARGHDEPAEVAA